MAVLELSTVSYDVRSVSDIQILILHFFYETSSRGLRHCKSACWEMWEETDWSLVLFQTVQSFYCFQINVNDVMKSRFLLCVQSQLFRVFPDLHHGPVDVRTLLQPRWADSRIADGHSLYLKCFSQGMFVCCRFVFSLRFALLIRTFMLLSWIFAGGTTTVGSTSLIYLWR